MSNLSPRARSVNGKHTQVAIYSMHGEISSEQAVLGAIQTHSKRVWRFGLALSGASDVADDLLQSTCLRALERHHQVTSHERLDSWLMTICRSIWLNEVRSRSVRKAQALSVTPEAELVATGPDTETNIFAAEVFTQVMQLPEAQRETVMLVFVEGYSYREAAALLEVPIGTIMSRLSNARQKLKTVMQHEAADAVRRSGK
ncbi:RNA polymerase sigma factor [Ruegeria arenilitoris]|uniref:RNA polymerase sigma factor n=1 Tax=Ruegeria arenilitoris TaxID=1173585 RepID=UPI0020C4AA1B|nr:RNA polymerase sigma factor [Ruegeria arenilitoris]